MSFSDPTDPFRAARAALLDHLPKDRILACYESAGGKELVSGKFANPASSACLAANAFGAFLEAPASLTSASVGLATSDTVTLVSLESQMRFPWTGGLHPWLDAHLETADVLIGIESKRYEPFRDRKTVDFSEAYARPVWGDRMQPFESMRAALQSGEQVFSYLDAAQLVKHAFGLRTQGEKRGRRPHLLYLYAEPKAFADGRPIGRELITAHRDEVERFAEAVRDAEVTFSSARYHDVLTVWSNDESAMVRDHGRAMLVHFDV